METLNLPLPDKITTALQINIGNLVDEKQIPLPTYPELIAIPSVKEVGYAFHVVNSRPVVYSILLVPTIYSIIPLTIIPIPAPNKKHSNSPRYPRTPRNSHHASSECDYNPTNRVGGSYRGLIRIQGGKSRCC